MISKIFIDSDVILDVATEREPFFGPSQAVLALAEARVFLPFTSPNSITNIYYIYRKLTSAVGARSFIKDLIEIVEVADVNNDVILKALNSRFYDFEDAVQHFCALKSRCDYIVTRNFRDYMFSEVKVLEPQELLLLYGDNLRPTKFST